MQNDDDRDLDAELERTAGEPFDIRDHLNIQPEARRYSLQDFIDEKCRLSAGLDAAEFTPTRDIFFRAGQAAKGAGLAGAGFTPIEQYEITLPIRRLPDAAPSPIDDAITDNAASSPLPFSEFAAAMRAAFENMRLALLGDDMARILAEIAESVGADGEPAEPRPHPKHRPKPSPVPQPAMPRRFASCNPRRYTNLRARARNSQARRT